LYGQYQPPAPPSIKAKRSFLRTLLLVAAFLATFVVGAGIGAAASGSPTKTSAARPTATVTVTAAATLSSPKTPSGGTTHPAPPAGPKTLLTAKGTGIKNTARFTTGNDWTIHWSYDCSKTFGGEGNFIVDVYDGSEESFTADGVNELGKKGTDTSPVYDDPGQHHLSVASECPWQLTVTEP